MLLSESFETAPFFFFLMNPFPGESFYSVHCTVQGEKNELRQKKKMLNIKITHTMSLFPAWLKYPMDYLLRFVLLLNPKGSLFRITFVPLQILCIDWVSKAINDFIFLQ